MPRPTNGSTTLVSHGRRKSLRRKKASSPYRLTKRILLVVFGCIWCSVVGFVCYALWYIHALQQTSTTQRQSLPQSPRTPEQTHSQHIAQQVRQRTSRIYLRDQHSSDDPPDPQPANSRNALSQYDSPLVIFACRRAEYLTQTLQYIEDALVASPSEPNDTNPDRQYICSFGCPIVVSQDGNDLGVTRVIQEFQQKWTDTGIPLIHLKHPPVNLRRLKGLVKSYTALSMHYDWALRKVFNDQLAVPSASDAGRSVTFPAPQRIIILEEDIQVAPDFFSYFQNLAPVLDRDDSLLAVSAFNDNGQRLPVDTVFSDNDQDLLSWISPHRASRRILRSDFFPGLGWMMTRRLWKSELEDKWPEAYWDDWLRDPEQRRGRQILRPEISRTYHFGSKGGASQNQFGRLLQNVKLNSDNVDWSEQDLSYLDRDEYERRYMSIVRQANAQPSIHVGMQKVREDNVRVTYDSLVEFQSMAGRLQIMSDEKASVPRTAYHGIVETRPFGEHILFLVPKDVAS